MTELWKYRILYLSGIVVMFLSDQATKLWAIKVLDHHNLVYTLIPDYIEFRITYNLGAAWGMFQGWTQGLAVMSTIMIIVILTVLGKTSLKDRLLGWAFTFQLGGAFGNLYDRLSHRQGVVDFINVYIPWGGGEGGFWYNLFGKTGLNSAQEWVGARPAAYDWPIFNLADVYVVIGTVLLLIYIIRMPPEEKKAHAKVNDIPEYDEFPVVNTSDDLSEDESEFKKDMSQPDDAITHSESSTGEEEREDEPSI